MRVRRSKAHSFLRLLCLMAGLAPVVIAAGSQALPAARGGDPTVVVTDRGPVRGVVRDGVREFKGIPYAQAAARRIALEPAAAGGGLDRHAGRHAYTERLPAGRALRHPRVQRRRGLPHSQCHRADAGAPSASGR